MKKYSFQEMLKELHNNHSLKFNGHAIYANNKKYLFCTEDRELTVYENGNKIKLTPYFLSECVYPSIAYFTKFLSHNERLIEKWSQVAFNTPIEVKGFFRTSLAYFKGLYKQGFIIDTFKETTKETILSDGAIMRGKIKLISDEEWDEFENNK